LGNQSKSRESSGTSKTKAIGCHRVSLSSVEHTSAASIMAPRAPYVSVAGRRGAKAVVTGVVTNAGLYFRGEGTDERVHLGESKVARALEMAGVPFLLRRIRNMERRPYDFGAPSACVLGCNTWPGRGFSFLRVCMWAPFAWSNPGLWAVALLGVPEAGGLAFTGSAAIPEYSLNASSKQLDARGFTNWDADAPSLPPIQMRLCIYACRRRWGPR